MSGSRLCLRFSHLNELISGYHFARRRFTRQHGVSHSSDIQLDRADRVVVAWDHVIDAVGIAVGIDNADYRYAQLVGFSHSNALVIDIHDKQHVGQTRHFLDAADGPLKLFLHTRAH